jgi:hypothetical protein
MKVGDLVTLSAYGQRLLMFIELHNKVGLVVRVDPMGTFGVRWQAHAKMMYMERKDIKKAK